MDVVATGSRRDREAHFARLLIDFQQLKQFEEGHREEISYLRKPATSP